MTKNERTQVIKNSCNNNTPIRKTLEMYCTIFFSEKLFVFQEQLARERTVSGRVQIQVWYHDERKELVVAVLAADDLAPRDESLGFGSLPEAYARLCLMPLT